MLQGPPQLQFEPGLVCEDDRLARVATRFLEASQSDQVSGPVGKPARDGNPVVVCAEHLGRFTPDLQRRLDVPGAELDLCKALSCVCGAAIASGRAVKRQFITIQGTGSRE